VELYNMIILPASPDGLPDYDCRPRLGYSACSKRGMAARTKNCSRGGNWQGDDNVESVLLEGSHKNHPATSLLARPAGRAARSLSDVPTLLRGQA
jgi:hypothetical protein